MSVTRLSLRSMFMRRSYSIRGLMAKYGLTRKYVEDAIRGGIR